MLVQTKNSLSKQKGIVLLGIVILFVLASIAYLMSGLSDLETKQYKLERTVKSLNQAKQALIAYAVTYGDIDGNGDTFPDFPGEYGFLPCPDYNGGLAEGLEDNGNCGVSGLPKLGYFPWRTLGFPVLKDADGACLLYAVTGEYKNDENLPSTKTQMLNEDTNGMFQIVNDAGAIVLGGNAEDRVVAIVFAPGKELPGQLRNFTLGSTCGRGYGNFNAYLEDGGGADNSDVSTVLGVLDQFIHATAASTAETNPNPYNDTFVTITRDEIWKALAASPNFNQKMTYLTKALAMCLSKYAATNAYGRLPWPVATTTPLTTTTGEYRSNTLYDDNGGSVPGYAGRFPFIVDNSNSALSVAVASNELFTVSSCNALAVAPGITVNLQSPSAEYRKLWDNWKDHFFYVVSQGYAPVIPPAVAACGTCITVGTGPAWPGPGPVIDRRAAVVFYGNSRQEGAQDRNEPIGADADTKFNVNNYLEGGNGGNFPDSAGDRHYSTDTAAATDTTTDIMYCLTTTSPPTVVQC